MVINLTSLVMVFSFLRHALLQADNDVFKIDEIDFCYSAYAVNIILPSLMAATNPLILVMFNADLKRRITFWKKTSLERGSWSKTTRNFAPAVETARTAAH